MWASCWAVNGMVWVVGDFENCGRLTNEETTTICLYTHP
jgi:hypothetical protein